jgi:tetratricopeptide (TPR) repeat protein
MRKSSIVAIALYAGLSAAWAARPPALEPTPDLAPPPPIGASNSGAAAASSVVSPEALASSAEPESESKLIKQVQVAEAAKDWSTAETLLVLLTTKDPDRWQYSQALADVRLAEGKYGDAAASYTSALLAAGQAKLTPAIRQAMALMYSNEGTAYAKLNRNADAAAAFGKAVELSDRPGVAWFNLCATQYDMDRTADALVSCDKVIAADPTKADAWFIRASILMGNSAPDAAGRIVAPAGTVKALEKYLELAPNGPHADDAKQMLDYLSGKEPGVSSPPTAGP